ncbi:T cell receptor beta chain MC.7.G5-like [Hemiscyllium ocellatum]|uniref:T cell receptor beta chain MC.7.G5-like n=1 Tax=Hemiscyllium ocellatum TaxID=170820 RepID=UPI00296764C1|nr:T cell receptor beta chain MC.7.G5-like [Hemiscyllium ocellatum]
MLHEAHYLIWTATMFAGTLTSYVEQSPSIVSIASGQSTTLKCTLKNTGYPNMFWYKQQPGRAFEALFNSAGEGSVTNYTFDSFKAERTSNTLFTLTLNDASPSHTAVYFCACSNTALHKAYFGGGTKLTVLEHDPKNPNITIFEPSPDEIKQKEKATVICLVTNFYPDNIKIHWFLDGTAISATDEKIQTDVNSMFKTKTQTYSISSRFRLDAQTWAKSKNIECKVEHYYEGSQPTTHSEILPINAEICGISKEVKMHSMATGKLTYLILICKSVFYGIFISILAWKTKTSSSKRFD